MSEMCLCFCLFFSLSRSESEDSSRDLLYAPTWRSAVIKNYICGSLFLSFEDFLLTYINIIYEM